MRKIKCDCGECKVCKAREYWRNNYSVKAKANAKRQASEFFPRPVQIVVWECSDGREFTSETDALRHELDLFRKG